MPTSRFDRFLFSLCLLLHSHFRFDDGRYGYGVFVHDYRGVRVIWHAGMLPDFGALLQMVPAHRFAVIILANRSSSLLNQTAEKAMELLLPLEAKPVTKSVQPLPVSEPEISEYVGTYTNGPENAEVVVKDGALILRRKEGELPITKIGTCRFTIVKPNESEPEDLVFVPGSSGEAEYLHINRHALRRSQLR